MVRDTRERKGLSLRLRYDSPTDRQRDREKIRPKGVARERKRRRRDFADEPRKWERRRRKPNSVEEEGEGGEKWPEGVTSRHRKRKRRATSVGNSCFCLCPSFVTELLRRAKK